jgi:hypothetical protein
MIVLPAEPTALPTLDTVLPALDIRLLDEAAGVVGVVGVVGLVGVVGVVPGPVPVEVPPVPALLARPPLPLQPASNAVSNMDAAKTPLFFDAFMIYISRCNESDKRFTCCYSARSVPI